MRNSMLASQKWVSAMRNIRSTRVAAAIAVAGLAAAVLGGPEATLYPNPPPMGIDDPLHKGPGQARCPPRFAHVPGRHDGSGQTDGADPRRRFRCLRWP